MRRLRFSKLESSLIIFIALLFALMAFVTFATYIKDPPKKRMRAGIVVNPEVAADECVPLDFRLKGEEVMEIGLGESYEEPGVIAWDEIMGDISANVVISGSVDTSNLGDYQIHYSVKGYDGQILSLTRELKVVDKSPADLKLAGPTKIYLKLGESFVEPGFSAIDNLDGDISANVKVESNLDVNTIGVYEINYSVSDLAANVASAKRKVFVYEPQAAVNTLNPGNKVVYLTFDDGPYIYTERLLNVLDKYNVKATFFVTNQYPAYRYLIGEEARRGHTVAIHSASHVYSEIYSSEEAYFNDFNKMRQIIIEESGQAPSIVRFPGGSDNTVSKKYCQGIMTSLVEDLNNMGYLYCDWTVVSGDASGGSTRDSVYNNVIKGISSQNVSLVLQHDIKGFSVDAVEDIIVWGLANGYTFLPLSESSPMSHFRIAN